MSKRPSFKELPLDISQRIINLRREIHQHPELSWQETGTSDRIAAQLRALGINFERKIANTGIIATIEGRSPGKAVALRADTDALPIQEKTGLPFASVRHGVMHACGHDGHTSMVIGAAAMLAAGPKPPRTIKLLWQPAEELGQGAAAMIKAGALDDVAMIFGGHMDVTHPAGILLVTEGAVNASTDTFTIEIHGKGSHGARPHKGIDAIAIGALLIANLQTIVSRELDPSDPAVLTVGSFHAGKAANVIAETAVLKGTLRAQKSSVRQHLSTRLEEICTSLCKAHGASATVSINHGTPPVINEGKALELAKQAALRVVAPTAVQQMVEANMGGEDFSNYLQEVPGCYIRFGAMIPALEGHPAHSSRFDIDEAALLIGAAWYAEVAWQAGLHLEATE